MSKTRTQARCQHCGHVEPRWLGRCPGCDAWGSMHDETVRAGERSAVAGRTAPADRSGRRARPIAEVPLSDADRVATGIGELDRVLGGGLVPGSVTLVGGEPGAGKSTLLLQAAATMASGDGGGGLTVLYVSAEESAPQVRARAERIGALAPTLLLASETQLPAILDLVAEHDPAMLICDSIQTVADPEVAGTPGGVGQVRECAAVLSRVAKERGMACLLVGHVTKDGQLAGPRVLEHLVDAVCEVDGDRHHALRLVRASKNRFGPVGEVGCFEMTGAGLAGVPDAGRLFVGDAGEGTAGVAVTIALEGHRALACEMQALVAPSSLTNPRRVASGVDTARLALLVAVCQRRADVDLSTSDVYASTVGGVRLVEPAVDLALCLALASSRWDRPVGRNLVALGEVGLAGELRRVPQTDARLAEAARLGFASALVPAAYDGPRHGLRVHPARDLAQALGLALPPAPR